MPSGCLLPQTEGRVQWEGSRGQGGHWDSGDGGDFCPEEPQGAQVTGPRRSQMEASGPRKSSEAPRPRASDNGVAGAVVTRGLNWRGRRGMRSKTQSKKIEAKTK